MDSSYNKPVPHGIAATQCGQLIVAHDHTGLIDVERFRGTINGVRAGELQRDRCPVGPSHEPVFTAVILPTKDSNNIASLVNVADDNLPGEA